MIHQYKLGGYNIVLDVCSGAVHVVDEAALEGYEKDLETIRGMSKSKAKAVAEDGVMTRAADAVIVLNNDTGEVVSFQMGQ